jgi:peptide chain release factor 2
LALPLRLGDIAHGVDHCRTNDETSDTDGLLNGDIDAFMAASLAQRVGLTRADA